MPLERAQVRKEWAVFYLELLQYHMQGGWSDLASRPTERKVLYTGSEVLKTLYLGVLECSLKSLSMSVH